MWNYNTLSDNNIVVKKNLSIDKDSVKNLMSTQKLFQRSHV